ncbi:MAG: alpha/beta hydrolase [Reichenbachiella sp.]|uniref:alpha/beta hydrolase n=1 Tax=Reichenbachiella sp. TaxID=2184521 RepID=UPI00329781A9
MRLLFTSVLLLLFSDLIGQSFQTLTYFEKDTISLDLDLFLPDKPKENLPLVIFVHGGGFATGDRSSGHALANHLVSQGIACASISYTLFMKDKSFSCDGITAEKIRAIQIAANQLWEATAYLIQGKNPYQIDKTNIYLAGSSAGAETVLHAAYWNRKEMDLFETSLDSNFRYTGIIAGAGAVLDLNAITRENHLPTMMFHGDKDELVPYATAAHHYCRPNASGWMMLFGSYSIAQHLSQQNGTVQLITFKGGGHDFANAFFSENQVVVSDFVKRIKSKEVFCEYRYH